ARLPPLRSRFAARSAPVATAIPCAAFGFSGRRIGALGRRCAFRASFFCLLTSVFCLVVVVTREAIELLHRVDDFRDVEERVALEADVDERGLHAREDLGHATLVDR